MPPAVFVKHQLITRENVDHVYPNDSLLQNAAAGAELHAARQRLSVPGRICTAMVLFPNTQPRKVGALPNVADRKLRRRRKRQKERIFAIRIHEVHGERTGDRGTIHGAQIGAAASGGGQRPKEFSSSFQIGSASKVSLEHS